ncbi:hypothetical protein Emag_001297 [Eimeria magna]
MSSSEEDREASDGGGETGRKRKRLRKPLDDEDSQMKSKGPSGGSSSAAASEVPETPDDAAGSAGREEQQEINLCSGLDDNLMALLLPESFASTPEASKGSQEQGVSMENEGGVVLRSSVEPSSSAVCSAGAEASARDILPVPSPAAEAHQVTVQNVIASGRVVVEGRSSAALDLRRIAVSCRLAEYNPRKISACIIRLRKPKCTGLIFRSGRVMVTGAQSEEAALRAARLLVKMLQAVLGPSSTSAVGNSGEKPAALTDEAASKQTEEKETEDKDNSSSINEASRPSEQSAAQTQGGRTPGEEALACKGSKGASSIRLTQFAVENIVATADCGLPVRLEGLAFDHKEFCSYEPELFAGLVYRYSPTPSLKAVLLIFVSGKVVITGMRSRAKRPLKPRLYVHHLLVLLTLCASVSSSRRISFPVPSHVRAAATASPAAATRRATATAVAAARPIAAAAAGGEPLRGPLPTSLVAFLNLSSTLLHEKSSLTGRRLSMWLIPRPAAGFSSTFHTVMHERERGAPPFIGPSCGLVASSLLALGLDTVTGESACNLTLAMPLVRHGSITTTAARARELCRLIDNKILLAKKGGLHNYRQALGFFYDKNLTRQLFQQAPQRFARRNNGFCRRVRLPFPRLGDAAKMCRVDLID